jgi:Xaa-Pro aminopeptidase
MYKSIDIRKHELAAEKLSVIRDRAFDFISKNIGKITEYDVKEFILKELEKEEMMSDSDFPIVACNENTSNMHYFPEKGKSKRIDRDCLVMIDLWARLKEGGFYADITWMAFTGNEIPEEVGETFEQVIKTRHRAIEYIKENLKNKKFPKGHDANEIIRIFLGNLEKYKIHRLGHSLGYFHAHGDSFNLEKNDSRKMKIGIPFTIEPGLYYKGKFGIRSEIDCYINEDYEVVITTEVQDEIVKI